VHEETRTALTPHRLSHVRVLQPGNEPILNGHVCFLVFPKQIKGPGQKHANEAGALSFDPTCSDGSGRSYCNLRLLPILLMLQILGINDYTSTVHVQRVGRHEENHSWGPETLRPSGPLEVTMTPRWVFTSKKVTIISSTEHIPFWDINWTLNKYVGIWRCKLDQYVSKICPI
jgi:hypothetical protein